MEDTKLILNKLDTIKQELDYIKERMIDPDTILTIDDLDSLREAEEDLKKGKIKRLV
ncbi:hypothetical protein HYY69_07430 [Candidatus Woesearchaeota archaeon]|nr:hypothetical protein [Candidatus Woesearchaeota archaeon]